MLLIFRMKNLRPKSIWFLIFLFTVCSNAQNEKGLWTKLPESKSATLKTAVGLVVPEKAISYNLDIDGLRNYLKAAPKRESEITSHLVLSFPVSQGGFEQFEIYEASILHPDLQKEMPNSRSYIGKSKVNQSHSIRFSVTPQGLYTMLILGDGSTQYINPLSSEGSSYMVFQKSDLPKIDHNFSCAFEDTLNSEKTIENKSTLGDEFIRTYRLAIASTVEYSEFHWRAAGLTESSAVADKKNAVMNAIMVTMTRVNAIYERELSISMQFVADNKDVIFIDTDTFSNDNADNLIYESQQQIDNIIGADNYDIGHTFSTGAGGLAELGSVCSPGRKAQGVTGSGAPVGDPYDIDFVAHEFGHQFGATHTFNGDGGNCGGGNRTTASAYEPGSGSTIMAYAGLCSPDNVQANSSDYFHQNSLQLIWNYINAPGDCAVQTPNGNAAPTATAGGISYMIPIATPYRLTGASTDADGTASHTYTWEQFDLGRSGSAIETNATGPLVRSFSGTTEATRYIPTLKDLRIYNGSTTWEKLATVSRDINFKLTVRDNEPYGRTASADMMVTTVDAAGPFVVTSQNESELSWAEGSLQEITWDIAGTTSNGINTEKVNILLSKDGGLTYPEILALDVYNDGSEGVIVPSGAASNCRVMVEAVGNIFFAINTEDFAIGYTVSKTCKQYSVAPNLSIPDNASSFETSAIMVPDLTDITDINVGVNIAHTYKGDLQLELVGPNNNEVRLMSPFYCSEGNLIVRFDDAGKLLDCNTTETNESYQPEEVLSVFNGENSQGTWTLKYADLGLGDSGILNSWFIEVCETTLIPIEPVDVKIDELIVFPNPNTGEFIIKLSPISKEVHVEVFDVRGRRIYTNYFIDEELINETINLHHAQAGLYVLKLTDGSKETVKKIIIK